jgi:hypothetical protein
MNTQSLDQLKQRQAEAAKKDAWWWTATDADGTVFHVERLQYAFRDGNGLVERPRWRFRRGIDLGTLVTKDAVMFTNQVEARSIHEAIRLAREAWALSVAREELGRFLQANDALPCDQKTGE